MDLCSDSGRNLQADLLCRNRIQRPTGPLEGSVVNRKRPRYRSLMEMLIIWDGGGNGDPWNHKTQGELEETLLRHLGGFGEGTGSSRAWECPPLWTPIQGSASLGRASCENRVWPSWAFPTLDLRPCEVSEVPKSADWEIPRNGCVKVEKDLEILDIPYTGWENKSHLTFCFGERSSLTLCSPGLFPFMPCRVL